MTINPQDFEPFPWEEFESEYERGELIRMLDPVEYEHVLESGYEIGVMQARAEFKVTDLDREKTKERTDAFRKVTDRVVRRSLAHVNGITEYTQLQRDADEIELEVMSGRSGVFEGYPGEIIAALQRTTG